MKLATPLLGALSLVMLTACSSEQPEADVDVQPTTTSTTADGQASSLQDQLDDRRAQWAQNASDETKVAYDDGVQAVRDAGVPESAMKAGDTAPDFTLPDANGNDVALSTLLEQGPVVVIFFRGDWCPYCNLTLAAWQDRLDEIEALGGQLVAISPQTPDYSVTTAERNALAFHVLSDVGHNVSDLFGTTMLITPEILEIWEGRIDLAAHNDGDTSGKLPLPATYLIAQDGTIAFSHVHPDYRVRAEPSDVIEVLRTLQ